MRRLLGWQLSVALLLAAMAAAAQVTDSPQNSPPPGTPPGANTSTSTTAGETSATPETLSPGVTVTGKKLHAERPLPKLPPNEFTNCTQLSSRDGHESSGAPEAVRRACRIS